MAEAMLKVPPAYMNLVELAAVAEVREGGTWVVSKAEELSRHLTANPGGHAREKDQMADVHGSSGYLRDSIAVLDQLFGKSKKFPYEVTGETSVLAHIAEVTAGKVIAPKIAGETGTSPIDRRAAETVEYLADALKWAGGEAARLHALAAADVEASKAEAS